MYFGRRAVVIGAGMAGLAAAGALADRFEQVTVLDRDDLSAVGTARAGTPQAAHAHGLLVGGLQALEALFPGFARDLVRAGAVPLRVNQDLREELPGRNPMPQRDFGMLGYTASRPLIENTVRRHVLGRGNVAVRQNCRVLGIAVDAAGQRVNGVHCIMSGDDCSETVPADMVVDASGQRQLVGELLHTIGRAQPRETSIGIDLGYTTAVMPMPDNAPTHWKVAITHPDLSEFSGRAVMLPVEGNRWMVTVAGRAGERPPGEWDELLAYLRRLATPTVYDAVRDVKPVGKLRRFVMIESVRRHYEAIADFPDGLIPVGDAICRFNPVYGQGMSVAAREAVLLRNMLADRASATDPCARLGRSFLVKAQELIDTPWSMAAIPDFAMPETRGERPADLEESLRFAAALSRIAERDASVQRLMVEVWHMLKPRSVYQDPELVRQVQAELATT